MARDCGWVAMMLSSPGCLCCLRVFLRVGMRVGGNEARDKIHLATLRRESTTRRGRIVWPIGRAPKIT